MNTYSPELKAQVIAEWLTGMPIATAAKKFKVPRTTVRTWTKGLIKPLVARERHEDIDTLVTEYVVSSLLGLRKVVDSVSSDEAWLKSQPIEGIASWVGVTADKLLSVLAAYGRGRQQQLTEEAERAALDLHATPAVGTRLD